MTRAINILLILLFVLIACDSANNVEPLHRFTYLKYFGKEGDQHAADILVDPNSGLFILGNSISLSGVTTGYILRTDFEGNVIWERQIGGPNETAVDIEMISNAGKDLVIAMNIGPESSSRIRVIRIDQNGNTIDSLVLPLHKFGGFKQVAKSITPLEQSGDFVVTGYADRVLIKETYPIDESNDAADILAFRLDNNLNVTDTVITKGGERDGAGIKAYELNTSGQFVLFSYTDRPYLTNNFGYNFSYDIVTSGIPVGKLVGTEEHHEILSAVVKVPQEFGSGFLLAGTSKETLDGVGSIYLVGYDDQLQYKFLETKISTDRSLEAVGVEASATGIYVVANDMSAGELSDVTLVKVTRSGAVEWAKSFGSREGDDTASAIAMLPDGRVVLAITMDVVTKKKIGLIVLNSDGSF